VPIKPVIMIVDDEPSRLAAGEGSITTKLLDDYLAAPVSL
jgi:hypothetical protein